MAKQDIDLALLKDLGHLDVSDLQGRTIPFHPLRDEKGWHLWIGGDAKLIDVPATPVEAFYYAEKEDRETDIYFFLLEFLQQRAFWPDVMMFVNGLYSDIQNLGATLRKLRLIFDYYPHKASRMVVTEIEYIFLTCRSIFDMLQELIVTLWSKVQLFNQDVKKTKLPTSYRKMVMQDNKAMTIDEIASKFKIPYEIAAIYASTAPFFQWLRSYRDLIAHSGHSPDFVFTLPEGFGVSTERSPFKDMNIWCDANTRPNNIGSLLSVFGHILATTFGTCDAFATAISTTIQFPKPVAPKHHLFMRGEHLGELVLVNKFIEEKPWYDFPDPAACI